MVYVIIDGRYEKGHIKKVIDDKYIVVLLDGSHVIVDKGSIKECGENG